MKWYPHTEEPTEDGYYLLWMATVGSGYHEFKPGIMWWSNEDMWVPNRDYDISNGLQIAWKYWAKIEPPEEE